LIIKLFHMIYSFTKFKIIGQYKKIIKKKKKKKIGKKKKKKKKKKKNCVYTVRLTEEIN